MFLIGEFSKLAQVSARLLRYYDQRGLLVPAQADRRTGYRYYSAAQLGRLNQILVLRDLGFSLEQIAPMVDRRLDADELRGMLTLRRAEALRDVQLHEARLRQLEHRLACLDDPADRGDDAVLMRPLEALRLLSTRLELESFDDARRYVARLLAELPPELPERAAEGLVIVSHAPEFEPDRLDLEIGFALRASDRSPPGCEHLGMRFQVREHAAVAQAAVSVRVGPPELAHATSAAIARWVEAAGHRISTTNRELFLRLPRPDVPPVVEMQFPLRDA